MSETKPPSNHCVCPPGPCYCGAEEAQTIARLRLTIDALRADLLAVHERAEKERDEAFRKGHEHHRANCGAYAQMSESNARALSAEADRAEAEGLLREYVSHPLKECGHASCRIVANTRAYLAKREKGG